MRWVLQKGLLLSSGGCGGTDDPTGGCGFGLGGDLGDECDLEVRIGIRAKNMVTPTQIDGDVVDAACAT